VFSVRFGLNAYIGFYLEEIWPQTVEASVMQAANFSTGPSLNKVYWNKDTLQGFEDTLPQLWTWGRQEMSQIRDVDTRYVTERDACKLTDRSNLQETCGACKLRN
jgi:hypothetical protein